MNNAIADGITALITILMGIAGLLIAITGVALTASSASVS